MLNDLKTQFGSSLRSVRRFLERPINLQQGNVTLGTAAHSLRAREKDEQRRRVRRMRRDLYELMQHHQGARLLMAHLDLVERTLRQEGLGAVEKLPVRVIAKALSQLERLVWDWSPAGLAELRSRMAILVKQRRAEVAVAPSANATASAMEEIDFEVSAPQVDHITEVDHAMFEEMERSWAGQLPNGAAAAIAQAKAGN
jgi:hypothetical protein